MGNAAEIQRIYVKKEHHGKGYGKEMFSFALKEAQKRGFDWAWLRLGTKFLSAQKT